GGLALEQVEALDPALARGAGAEIVPGDAASAADAGASGSPSLVALAGTVSSASPCPLVGAAWRGGGAGACLPRLAAGDALVSARWRVGAPLPPAELAFFAQLVDDRGQRLAGRDRAGVEAARLEPGDE